MSPLSRTHGTVVGRDELAHTVRSLIDRAPLVTLRGAPGVGTSTLARLVSHALASHRVAHTVVRSAQDRDAILTEIALALAIELHATPSRIALDRVASALDATPTLLVIDAHPSAIEPLRAVVADLLSLTHSCALLVCGQRALGLAVEQVVDVPPLSIEAAMALLRQRVAQRSPIAAATLSVEHTRILAERASCLPLALELLAARVCAMGVGAALSEEPSFEGLSTLDAALDAALAALDGEHPALVPALAALSIFEGPFDRDAAHAAIGEPEAQRADAIIEALVSASLLHVAHDQGAARFRVLSVVRAFVLRSVRTDDARTRLARYLAHDHTHSQWEQLCARRAMLLSSWRWAIGDTIDHPRDRRVAIALVARVEQLLLTQGPVELHHAVLSRTVALVDEDSAELVEIELSLAKLDAIRGRLASAVPVARAALARAERLMALRLIASCATVLCYTLTSLDQREEARMHGERAIAIANELRSHALLAQCTQVLASLDLREGHVELAAEGYRRALASARVAQSPRIEGICLANLARCAQAQGRWDDGLALLAQAQARFEAHDDRVHLARLAVHRESLLVALGHRDRDPALLEALDRAIAQGNCVAELEAREALARSAAAQRDPALWSQRIDELDACARFSDDPAWIDRSTALRLEYKPTQSKSVTSAAATLSITRDGALIRWGDSELDFTRRGPLRRVLLALVSAHSRGAALSANDVRDAGWPGERMLPESAAARVYMAIRRLRTAGLEALIRTSGDGYSLDRAVQVRWLDARC